MVGTPLFEKDSGVGVGMLRGAVDSLTCKNKSYQIAILCFLIDVDPVFKNFKNLSGGS